MTLLSHSFQGTELDSFSTKNKPRGSQVDHVCGLGRTVRGADTPASGSSPPVCERGPPREVLPAIDAAYLTGMMGEAGIFLTKCWLHTNRDVSKTFNHARVPSWFLTHTLPPALGDAIAGDRGDLRGPLSCCQCRDQAARQGQEAMKPNLLLETEPQQGEPLVIRHNQPPLETVSGATCPVGGSKADVWH